ncbi:hypothetical protein K440DRAFT_652377 [Wilcoxina mikolae CBS 423.85]|nr:hypothetical protein K440DRAFT_652377 [Wilcoxina mikolae CBS 423.85]
MTAPGNPLLVEFLKEWYETAKERDTKAASTYKRALESMTACPIPFTHPSECSQLKGIGPKIVERLTKSLESYNLANGLPPPQKPRGAKKRNTANALSDHLSAAAAASPAPKRRKTTERAYVPKLRSGAYAVLIALLEIDMTLGNVTKQELMELAQPYCDASFEAPVATNKSYTAWSSVKGLVEKGLVWARGNPKRYCLTEDGIEVARGIVEAEKERGGGGVGGGEGGDGGGEDDDGDAPARGGRGGSSGGRTQGRPAAQRERGYYVGEEVGGSSANTAGARGRTQNKPAARKRAREPSIDVEAEGETEPQRRRRTAHMPVNTVFERIDDDDDDAPDNRSVTERRAEAEARRRRYHLVYSGEASTATTSRTSTATISRTSTATISRTSTNTSTTSAPTFPRITTPTVLHANTFTIQLILDNREVRSKTDREYVQNNLIKAGVTPHTRALQVGDALWVARNADHEVVLDYIVERKRLDDLLSSIKDGRFHEQKFRLTKSGIKNVVYIIEDFSLPATADGSVQDAIDTAISSTQVVNGFFVKRTKMLDDTIRYLARMTRMLEDMYRGKDLYLIPDRHVESQTYAQLREHLVSTYPEKNWYLSYEMFSTLVNKSASTTLRDLFLKMLMCVRGVSAEKAVEIQRIYGTPIELVEAYERCRDEKERGEMVAEACKNAVGRRKVGVAVSRKIKEVWWGVEEGGVGGLRADPTQRGSEGTS